ncbi:MAG: heparan-alpha-glucosaminide N-acetyltransferase [Atribacterota bacterium]
MERRRERFAEIDALRGCAIVMMLLYHALFDLVFFGNLKANLFSPFWKGYVVVGASLFVGLAGLSLTLRFAREREKRGVVSFFTYLRRGLSLFAYGMAITAVTYLVLPEAYIRFGVLHCIGVSTILAYPLVSRPWLSLPLGFICIVLGNLLSHYSFPFSFLLWLGLKPQNFLTLDYFPLLPWFGVVLLGTFVGNLLYPLGKRRFAFPEHSHPLVRSLAFLGRHSLTIYLLHQPAILALFFVLGLIRLPL